MKKILYSVLLGTSALFAADQSPKLLFQATFDKFSTVPEVAADKTARGLSSDLSKRKFSGPAGNAVCLQNTEFLTYSRNNVNSQTGTLMFRTSPQNWQVADAKVYQLFFEIRGNDFRYFIYRGMGTPNLLTFIVIHKNKSFAASCPITRWKTKEWHHVAATWNAEGIQLFVDGRPSRFTKFKDGFALPKQFKHCAIRFNSQAGWRHNKEWKTAYDDIQIYNTSLTPQQIADAAKKPQQIITATKK